MEWPHSVDIQSGTRNITIWANVHFHLPSISLLCSWLQDYLHDSYDDVVHVTSYLNDDLHDDLHGVHDDGAFFSLL